MYNTCTVLGSYIVARDNTEGICALVNHLVTLQGTRFHPRHQLLIVQAYQISTLTTPQNLYLLAFLCLEVSAQAALSQDIDSLFTAIGISTLYSYIVNLRTNTECCIRGQCPRRCCPSQDIGF